MSAMRPARKACCPPPTLARRPQSRLDPLARDVPCVGCHAGGEGEAGQRVAPKLAQQVARLLQRLELQRVEGVEDLREVCGGLGVCAAPDAGPEALEALG